MCLGVSAYASQVGLVVDAYLSLVGIVWFPLLYTLFFPNTFFLVTVVTECCVSDGGFASDRLYAVRGFPQVSRYHQVGSEFIYVRLAFVFRLQVLSSLAEFLWVSSGESSLVAWGTEHTYINGTWGNAAREEAFKSWAANVVNLNLEELQRLLVEAERELEREEFLHPDDKGLAAKRAKVSTLKNTVSGKMNAKEEGKDKTDNKKSIKEWSELNRVLGDVEDSFNDIGGTVGDVAGDIIKTAGTIATSTLSIIDGITTLSENSAGAMTGTAEVAAESMSKIAWIITYYISIS